jgi:hypothetical protein
VAANLIYNSITKETREEGRRKKRQNGKSDSPVQRMARGDVLTRVEHLSILIVNGNFHTRGISLNGSEASSSIGRVVVSGQMKSELCSRICQSDLLFFCGQGTRLGKFISLAIATAVSHPRE